MSGHTIKFIQVFKMFYFSIIIIRTFCYNIKRLQVIINKHISFIKIHSNLLPNQ